MLESPALNLRHRSRRCFQFQREAGSVSKVADKNEEHVFHVHVGIGLAVHCDGVAVDFDCLVSMEVSQV